MNTSPNSSTPDLANHPAPHDNPHPSLLAPEANGSLHPVSSHPPIASKEGSAGPRALPSGGVRRRRWTTLMAGVIGLLALGGGILAFVAYRPASARPDVLLHTVKRERLDVTVVEKGTLESADNIDIVCRVKAGQKGFASTINWVIADGSRVARGDRLIILDDSALQEQLQAQQIVVDTSEAAKVKAEEDYTIIRKQNESDIAAAETAVVLAAIELEKYLGVNYDDDRGPLAALIGIPAALTESGVYRQSFDDLTGQVRLAESEVEQNRERAAWAERMVKQKYMSAAQAQSERSRLDSSIEKFRSLQAQKNLLVGYERKKMLTDLKSKLDLARRTLDQKIKEAHSKEVQAESEKRHKLSLYQQSVDKYREIQDQIELCKIKAPRDGMVVYYKQESRRFSSSDSMIEQGLPVKEGQKLLRIPNLEEMQVNTKVHEAMVSQIRGDRRVSTGIMEALRSGNAWQPNIFARLLTQRDDFMETIREGLKHQQFRVARKGSHATVKVDAVTGKVFQARVKSVAAVASQADSWISDVKLFPTLVLIEEKVSGLKPDMSAEVTIHVDGVENVLCVPVQAIFSHNDLASKRKVFVKTATGTFEEREVELGLFNQKMIEVKAGLKEGDEVVINPKALLGESAAKVHEGGGSKESGKDDHPAAKKGGAGKKGSYSKKPPAAANDK